MCRSLPADGERFKALFDQIALPNFLDSGFGFNYYRTPTFCWTKISIAAFGAV